MSDESPRGVRAFVGRLASEHINRSEAILHEIGRLEGAGADQARAVIDEWARLARDSVSYSFALHEQWRRGSILAARKTLAFFGIR
jgi:hypothetical protein